MQLNLQLAMFSNNALIFPFYWLLKFHNHLYKLKRNLQLYLNQKLSKYYY